MESKDTPEEPQDSSEEAERESPADEEEQKAPSPPNSDKQQPEPSSESEDQEEPSETPEPEEPAKPPEEEAQDETPEEEPAAPPADEEVPDEEKEEAPSAESDEKGDEEQQPPEQEPTVEQPSEEEVTAEAEAAPDEETSTDESAPEEPSAELEVPPAEPPPEEKAPPPEPGVEEEEEPDFEKGIFAIKTSIGHEKMVADTLEGRIKRRNADVYSIMLPPNLRGYLLIEALDNREALRDLIKGVQHARTLVEGTTTIEEIEGFLTPKPIVSGIEEGDIVEVIAGPFKGEKAKVKQIDLPKEEITIELFEAMVSIPVTIRGDHVRVLEKESS